MKIITIGFQCNCNIIFCQYTTKMFCFLTSQSLQCHPHPCRQNTHITIIQFKCRYILICCNRIKSLTAPHTLVYNSRADQPVYCISILRSPCSRLYQLILKFFCIFCKLCRKRIICFKNTYRVRLIGIFGHVCNIRV